MKLLRLWIGKYRVLEDITICFAESNKRGFSNRSSTYALDFLVGVNGTGKSTVLRALSEIFQRLAGDSSKANFLFEIKYSLRGEVESISISNCDPDTKQPLGRYRIRRAAENNQEIEEVDEIALSDLPQTIIAYTTGVESEWRSWARENIFRSGNPLEVHRLSPEELAIQELPGKPSLITKTDRQQQPLFLFAEKAHIPTITLCGFLTNLTLSSGTEAKPLDEVLREVKINAFRGFSLRFRMNQTTVQRNEIWQRLGRFATRRINVGAEYLFVYDYSSHHNAVEILQESGGGLALYRFLADLQKSNNGEPILTEVNLFIERTKSARSDEQTTASPLHLFEWLSDGEQNFVGRLCLFTLFGGIDALILLDEPEVHFNDYWKRQIVHFIDRVFHASNHFTTTATDQNHTSHLLISTHSSIALTDAHTDEIIRMERDDINTQRATRPRFQTFGADPSDIMVHIFDAPQPNGEYSVQQIKARIEEARQGRISKIDLEQALKFIAPGYWSYRVRRELIRQQ